MAGRMNPALVIRLQIAMIAALVAGALTDTLWLTLGATGLMLLGIAIQIRLLLPLARIFLALAAGAAGAVLLFMPGPGAEALTRALVQGTGFAALMAVLGMLRHPVRRSATVRAAAGWLAAFPARRRFAAVNAGAHVLSLLLNLGIIGTMGDLVRREGEAVIEDPGRRAMVLAAMRGAGLVTIWSPLGLGFAIVTAGIPALSPVRFLLLAAGFTALALLVTSRWPLLPPDAALGDGETAPPRAEGSGRAMARVLAVCALLLAGAIILHHAAAISFTLAAVAILPVFALVWPRIERDGAPAAEGLRATLAGLTDMRSEGAIFVSANVIGSAIAIALQGSGHDPGFTGAWALPALLALLLLIPLAAACFLPNAIVVVIAAQLFGAGPLGAEHPMALALVLAVGWAAAISVSPISAMCLVVARFCGTSPQRVAWRWNPAFALVLTGLAALTVSALVLTGAG